VRYELSLARRSRACSWVTDILKEKSTALIAAGVKPSMSLKVSYDLEDTDGEVLKSEIHATVYDSK
jgi:hypothetical protein